MIRILLCCGGGFSSSAIASRMDKEIKEKNLEEKYSIEFLPFGLGLKELDRFDVVILCPHLKVELDKALKNQTINKPLQEALLIAMFILQNRESCLSR